ncbi:MAG: hypothetical protein WBO36_04865 [Saprospiraceae bacterium]
MGKLVSWVVLGLFLVIVPFGSWYYLQKGLDYRKNALRELEIKDSLSIRVGTFRLFQNKTSLVVLDVSDDIYKIKEALLEQYKSSIGFQILYPIAQSDVVLLPEDLLKYFKSKYPDDTFVLVDESRMIRNTYKSDEASVKKLVEHIAIVLPRPKESDIKMKH